MILRPSGCWMFSWLCEMELLEGSVTTQNSVDAEVM